ncbi:MAG: hypothetical protein JEY99_21665 [Spirochaetales bacterium]|nr:hypothetical protein [Spirochaetales bacterium]
MKRLVVLGFLLLCSVSTILLAADDSSGDEITVEEGVFGDLDDLLGGFETDDPITLIVDEPSTLLPVVASSSAVMVSTESPFTMDGRLWLKSGWAYAFEEDAVVPFDRAGLSLLRGGISLHSRIRFGDDWFGEVSGKAVSDLAYMIKGWDAYSPEQLESARQEAVLYEAFIDGSVLPDWQIRVGRQIFSLGKADQLQVLDRLNPLDLRTPGLQEIQDIKLPVGAVKLSWSPLGVLTVSGALVSELRQAEMPVYGSEFYQAGSMAFTDLWPESGEDENEYFLSADLNIGGWDLSLVYGYYLWDIPRLENRDGQMTRVYDRVHTAGGAAETALGPLILTLEGGYIHGFGFQADPDTEYSRIDLLGGVSWKAPLGISIAMEICLRHFPDLDETILMPFENAEQSSWESSLRLSRSFFHERLKFNVAAMLMGLEMENGGIIRADAEWELSDGFKAKITWADYLDGKSGMLKGAGDNDRILFSVTRSF